jgi:hypothetical protein
MKNREFLDVRGAGFGSRFSAVTGLVFVIQN